MMMMMIAKTHKISAAHIPVLEPIFKPIGLVGEQ